MPTSSRPCETVRARMSRICFAALFTSFSSCFVALAGSAGASALIARYPAEYATDLHKFALSAAGPQYRGSGSVAGHLGWEQDKKSFRMGEYQGVLRIATSLGDTWGTSATHRLSVLQEQDGALSLLAQLPNAQRPAPLGKPGEKIYAARFVGNRGYLVTFRVTDPMARPERAPSPRVPITIVSQACSLAKFTTVSATSPSSICDL